MDADAIGHEKALLMRARLHIRAGKRRLHQEKISAGLVTLYDALSAAMKWYLSSPERRNKLSIGKDDDLKRREGCFLCIKMFWRD
jgi:hypothetical protein